MGTFEGGNSIILIFAFLPHEIQLSALKQEFRQIAMSRLSVLYHKTELNAKTHKSLRRRRHWKSSAYVSLLLVTGETKNNLLEGLHHPGKYRETGPEVIKLFSCSTQLSMKFFLLINVKMPTIVGILTFMSGKNNFLGLSEPNQSQNS